MINQIVQGKTLQVIYVRKYLIHCLTTNMLNYRHHKRLASKLHLPIKCNFTTCYLHFFLFPEELAKFFSENRLNESLSNLTYWKVFPPMAGGLEQGDL